MYLLFEGVRKCSANIPAAPSHHAIHEGRRVSLAPLSWLLAGLPACLGWPPDPGAWRPGWLGRLGGRGSLTLPLGRILMGGFLKGGGLLN